MTLPADLSPTEPRTSAQSALFLTSLLFLWAGCSSGSAGSDDNADKNSSDSVDTADSDTTEEKETQSEEEGTDGPDVFLRPDVGDVIDIPEEQWSRESVAIAPATGDEQYVIQLTSVSTKSQTKYAFNFDALEDGSSPSAPSNLVPAAAPKPTLDGLALSHFDAASRRFRELAARSIAAGASPASPPPRPQPPQVGERTSFEISNTSTYKGFTTIDAEVLRVTDRLIVYGDLTNGIGALQSEVIDEVLNNYETVVLPRIDTYFGEISDVNGDEKISVLFSPLVSEVGAAAYVYTCDILDPEKDGIMCPYSNEQEMIYVAPPSHLGSHMGSPKALSELLSHETQHLVYFYRKYILGHGIMSFDTIYLNEGLSGLAQDLCGFQAGILFETVVAIPNAESFSLTDILTLKDYDPSGRHNYAVGYLLMRYVFEQMGGDTLTPDGQILDEGGISFLNTLESSRLSGIKALEDATGMDAADVFENFYTAMLLDDRAADGSNLSEDPRFGFFDMLKDPITGNTRGITMNLELAGGMVSSQGVPIDTEADGVIRSGGVDYILLDASKTLAPVTLRLEVDDPEAKMRMRLIRIR